MAISKKVGRGSKCKNIRRHPQYRWAKELTDNLYSHLSSIKSTVKTQAGTDITISKYHNQASQILEDMMSGVEIFPYQIQFSDLTPSLSIQLLEIALKDYVISGVVHRMMKYANPKLYNRAEKLRGVSPYQWIIC